MVSEKGIVALPNNFEKLSEKKQKNTVIAVLIEYNQEIATGAELDSAESKEHKALSMLIKNSKEGRRLEVLKKGKTERKKLKERLLLERNGVLKLAKRMGLDITEELKKLNQIEG